ncbi:MAG: sigma-70 family RNA polymerase sigma factor [Candidatus Hydrogenedentes bacterium]|nr:sigma-70 family RNA polymerase sigma factor [Candidatus Hydrogenedentota bacterium]
MTYSTHANGTDESDERLMAAICDDSGEAFETLVHRYESPLYNYAFRVLDNREDARDVFQETFLRVYKHRPRYRRGAPVRPWIYRIATNLCRDKLRARRRRPTIPLDAPASRDPDAKPVVDTLPDGRPNPAADAGAAELQARLHSALQRLPIKQRTVFVMARYQNMPYSEIARALFIPQGTVKSRMNKAVQFLMDELKDLAP